MGQNLNIQSEEIECEPEMDKAAVWAGSGFMAVFPISRSCLISSPGMYYSHSRDSSPSIGFGCAFRCCDVAQIMCCGGIPLHNSPSLHRTQDLITLIMPKGAQRNEKRKPEQEHPFHLALDSL